MTRVKRGILKNKRKGKILKLAKGFRNARSTKYKQAKQAVIRAGQHSFAHRRKKKREMRKNWQLTISYAVKEYGMSYSKFMDALTKGGYTVNRKMLAEIIKSDPEAFARIFTEVTGNKATAAPKKESVKEEAPKKAETKKEAKSESDDLTKIEGIGPKIAETLTEAGVGTYAELSKKKADEISEMISEVKGSHDPETWPKQAEMAAEGKWDELKAWQDELNGGSKA